MMAMNKWDVLLQCTLVKAQKERKRNSRAKKLAVTPDQGFKKCNSIRLLAFVVLMIAGICTLFC
jgi:hypothetical protein